MDAVILGAIAIICTALALVIPKEWKFARGALLLCSALLIVLSFKSLK